jgi:hypothetical protein
MSSKPVRVSVTMQRKPYAYSLAGFIHLRYPDSYRIDVNLILRTNHWNSIAAKAPADFAD